MLSTRNYNKVEVITFVFQWRNYFDYNYVFNVIALQILTNAARRMHNSMLRGIMATKLEFFQFHTAGKSAIHLWKNSRPP